MRHWLVWTAIVVQSLFAVTCTVGAWVLWGLTHDPKNIAEGPDTMQGLYIGLAGAAGCAVIYTLVAVGMWFRRRWAWWLGVVLNGIAAIAISSDLITDRSVDWDDVPVAVVMLAVTVLLLLPPVRKWTFGKGQSVVIALGDSVVR